MKRSIVTDFFSDLLDRYLYTELTTGSSVFHDLNNEHTAVATGRQGMLPPPWHLLPPQLF